MNAEILGTLLFGNRLAVTVTPHAIGYVCIRLEDTANLYETNCVNVISREQYRALESTMNFKLLNSVHVSEYPSIMRDVLMHALGEHWGHAMDQFRHKLEGEVIQWTEKTRVKPES